MVHSRLSVVSIPAAVVVLGVQLAGQPSSQSARRTQASGSHDLDGIWNYATMTPLERPRNFADKEVLTEKEAAAYERQVTQRQATTNNTAGPDWWDPGTRHLTNGRTSLIVDPPDGRLPPMTPAAQAHAASEAEARRRGVSDGPEDLALNVRCLLWATAGPPMLPGVYNNNVRIMEAPGYVVIFNEMIHDARIVPTDGRPHGTVPRWMGDSRGHWEGDALVIETDHFTAKTSVRGSDDHLKLAERFKRIDDETIEYRFTVEDPTVWTKPWTASFPLKKTTGPMYEYACHEGNSLSVEGILRASRVQDRTSR